MDVGEEFTRSGSTSAAEEEDINFIWKITKLQIKRRSIYCFLESRIKVFDLIMCLSDTIGLADPVLVNHNKEVAYIDFKIGEELGLKNGELAELILAGILHDIGYFSSEEKDELFNFVAYDVQKHGEIGYKLLKTYSPLLSVANIVRFHHVFWDKGNGKKFKDQDVPLASHIIHLADRISVVIDKNKEILGQIDNIYDLVVEQSDHMFKPELVKVFANIKDKEYLWLDLSSKNLTYILNNTVNDGMVDLGINALMELSQLFAKIIDFRSSFTATHSSGVAVSAEFLAGKIGFSKNQCKMMKVAGYLHDLGKLAIPSSILEKGEDFPFIPVGEFELNKNPDNYFAQIEQAAFNPANVVPGISFSPDRMLQGRLFSYGDAQRYRLVVNHNLIPVNMPKGVENPHSFHRDGQMRVDGNLGSELQYEPNSYGNWKYNPTDNPAMEKGGDVYRYDFREDDSDYYTQPGLLFNTMTEEQKQVLFDNTARNMGDSTLQIKHRHIYNCYQADPKYGEGVANAMNIAIEDVDLNLPKKDSHENLQKANNLHPELNIPTDSVDPGKEIDTNVDEFIKPKNDPWVL